jgi:methionine-S-sulfoxide reductase
MKEVIFAGGCFWCVEHDLRQASGVEDVISGYMGGSAETANYDDVSSHNTEHREVVQVIYDENKTNFRLLTQFFLDHIDPTDDGGQFGDRGENYKTAIYYSDELEQNIALDTLQELDDSGVYTEAIQVDILPRTEFYPAEDYHQQYSEKNPQHYQNYRIGSGREGFVQKTCQIREQKHINWKYIE